MTGASCKKIAVDLDETLAHTLEALSEWHNENYSTNLALADFNSHDYSDVWGGTRDEAVAKVREFYDSPQFDSIRPIQDYALEKLKMLKKRRFSLVMVTSRPQCVAEKTKRFVDRHYPGIFDSIYFCNLYLTDEEQLDYVAKSKSEVCREIGADTMIDDSLEHCLDCAALGINVLLYDWKGRYRWNQHCPEQEHDKGSPIGIATLPPNVKRMRGWPAIYDCFPQPKSPLSACHYPSDFSEEEEEEFDDDESTYVDPLTSASITPMEYETVEIHLDELPDSDSEDVDPKDYLNSKQSYANDPSSLNDNIIWV